MKFRMLFPAVLIDFPNSKVCLIGEWSTLLNQVNITPLEPFSQMSLCDNFNFFRASVGLKPLRVILFLKVCEKCQALLTPQAPETVNTMPLS